MSTTPRTDAAWAASFSPDRANFSVRDECEKLETELETEKTNRNHLIEKGAKLETELAAAKAECERIKVIANEQNDIAEQHRRELAQLRAEVSEARRAWLGDDYGHLPLIEALEKFRSDSDAESERADVLYQRSCEVEHALRAEVKRWQAEAEEMSAQRSHNANQAGILRAEVERLKEVSGGYYDSFKAWMARAERAEADTARLDWFEKKWIHQKRETFRAAIDAAMKEEIK